MGVLNLQWWSRSLLFKMLNRFLISDIFLEKRNELKSDNDSLLYSLDC